MSEMVDLRPWAKIQFYAGPPTMASRDALTWDGHDYYMEVRLSNGRLEAVMTSGNVEWRCPIDADEFKESVNAALEDACDLGHIANYSRDPER